ncbi:MAG: hypothetical protein LIO94_06905 [Clostridiales bacterium]|nr:hypothetical protein [Clostridiales bacterium]
MERYEMANGSAYTLESMGEGYEGQYEVAIELDEDLAEEFGGDELVVFNGTYSECRRYIEDERKKARA